MLLIGCLVGNNAKAIGVKIDSGFIITENNIASISEQLNIPEEKLTEIITSLGIPLNEDYILESQDIIDIANELKKLNVDINNKDTIISEQEKLIEGLEKEINLQSEIINNLKDKNNTLEISKEEYEERTNNALKLANELLQLERERNKNLTEQNSELQKQAALNIFEKLQYAALGIIIYEIAK